MFGTLIAFALVAFVFLIACDLIASIHWRYVYGSEVRIPVPIWQHETLESRSLPETGTDLPPAKSLTMK